MLTPTLAIPTLLLVIFIFILSLLFLHPKKHHQQQHGPKKIPPGPKSLPIIGNLHMLGKLPHRNLQSLANKYGPIMSLKLGQVPTIVVSSPESAELFLKTHDSDFASRPKIQASEYLFYGGKGIGMAEYGSYWRSMRKLLTSNLLSASKVEMFGPLRKRELGALVETLEKASCECEVVDVSELVAELIENIAFKMILGSNNRDKRFDLKGHARELMSLVGAFNLADYVPWLSIFDPQGLASRMKKLNKVFDQVLEQIIKDHEHPSHNEHHNNKDFVDILLSLMDHPIDPHQEEEQEQHHVIDRATIKAILVDMMVGASDTSTTAIEWAMSELLRHPRVMKKLQHEIENVVGINRQVEESDLEKLPYLDMVVKETFRLYPVGPLLGPRESLKDATIDGYYIKGKSRLIINAWAIGRDPKVWLENAEIFHPERFEDSNIDVRGYDYRLIPFGSGRRGCAGMNMGLTTFRLVLAQLVHCFNWELPFGITHEELDMTENFGLTMPRSEHLLAVPTYRLLNK